MSEPPSDGQPWWHGRSAGPPDIEGLLGPEAMAAVGGVAEEALKLFVVVRDRFAAGSGAGPAADPMEPGQSDPGPSDVGPASALGPASPLAAMMGQLASGAMHAVQDMMGAASQAGQGASDDSGEPLAGEPVIAPGEAAACSYCPICQGIALFRSVPITTWQRLAQSVIEVADAARDYAGRAPESEVVSVEPYSPQDRSVNAVDDFLRSIDESPGA